MQGVDSAGNSGIMHTAVDTGSNGKTVGWQSG